jgi:formate dehydrogenase maturation protein FdhE
MATELVSASAGLWSERRGRALQLLELHPHAAELLQLYAALCEGWSQLAEEMSTQLPDSGALPAFAAGRMMPKVVEATLAAGPRTLCETVLNRYHQPGLEEMARRWLDGAELPAVDRYLARASVAPVLEALPALARATGSSTADPRHCPNCGGLPQLSYFGVSGEALMTAPRQLLCSRCAQSWVYPRMICAGCGGEDTSRLPIFSDLERFPSLRIDACEACESYLVTVDVPKDPRALPVVDELAALPLDLYAQERGFHKITPNLMGF